MERATRRSKARVYFGLNSTAGLVEWVRIGCARVGLDEPSFPAVDACGSLMLSTNVQPRIVGDSENPQPAFQAAVVAGGKYALAKE